MLTHDTPNIEVSNYVAQVKGQPRTSWTESRECTPYFCASKTACAKDMFEHRTFLGPKKSSIQIMIFTRRDNFTTKATYLLINSM